jgi:hypothetical protein
MPTRRIWRFKSRCAPLTPFQWAFFLVQDVKGFDRLAEVQGDDAAEFFVLYYDDGWKKTYMQHRQEIEAEWKRRNWTRKQKQFVMTPYASRGFVLAHDARRDREMAWWRQWQDAQGWTSGESFPEYAHRLEKREGKTR